MNKANKRLHLQGFIRLLLPITFFCATIMVLCATVGTAYADAPKRTVRVGYIGYEGFAFANQSGRLEGYCIDYLEELEKYTDLRFEYVYTTWERGLEQLESQSIDLLCNGRYFGDMGQRFAFSRQRLGLAQGRLYAAPENTDLYYGDITQLNGRRIAFLTASGNDLLFDSFARENDIQYTAHYYASDIAMEHALLAGEVDLIATEQLARHDQLKYIGNYGSEQFYLISYLGNDFMQEINEGMDKIAVQNVGIEDALYQKHYLQNVPEKPLPLTREETVWLQAAPTLAVAVSTEVKPMAYHNQQGEMTGITIDLLNEISRRSGLKFTYIELPSRETPYLIDELSDMGVSLLSGIAYNSINSNLRTLSLTQPYVTITKSLLVRQGEMIAADSAQRLATVGGSYSLPRALREQFPNFSITPFDSIEGCLHAVLKGDADVFLYNQYALQHYLQKPQYDKLSIVPGLVSEEGQCLSPMPALQADTQLVSILNKAIASIPQQTVDIIIAQHTVAQSGDIGFGDILYKYRVPISLVSVLLIICWGQMLWLARVRKKNLEQMRMKNAQLADALQQAEQASRAKSGFFSRMSHEIRTPMNAIVGITAIAQKHKDDPQRVEASLDKIAVSSKILLSIINDVLDMSAIESDKLKVSQQEFDIKQLLNGLSSIFYTQCRAKGISFDITVNIEEETLIGDSLRMNQVLMNLLSNAYKFTERGGSVRIQVIQTEKREDLVFLRFIVSDTGIGMSKEMLERLFVPFEQEMENGGGSGLGMCIAKNLIDLMHGAIAVESEKGVGTTFTVDMPFGRAVQQHTPDPERLKHIQALIIDDDSHAREYTAIVLERIGIRYDIACSGEEALALLMEKYNSGNGYDICFVDWKMPGMNGIDVIKKIRSQHSNDTLITVLSAYDLSEVDEEARAAGADMLIPKPLFQSSVFNLLVQHIGRQNVGAVTTEEYDFTGRRLLLAEDNALNQEIAKELLESVHFQVDTAENGKIALERFLAEPAGTYDAILMDIQMPIMDGYEATRKIRSAAHPQAGDIPILAMTANAFAEDVSACMSAGMNGHVAKPVDTEILYQTLKKWIDGGT